ncbi:MULTISPECIES: head-tail connector protein [unclassified Ensifer]|uniref:head-tail connector protein n=1 Tax=unclassified Ensifer TaxID=2633371 RepID=UPI000813346E|nr:MULTISPECIES: head-tail connector protein [unclassified Ensifer]OCP17022.1 DNA-packaging protein [Ensifer sp. LC163]OCP24149.1 DNA-packaging protein [Ensifer sp. LC384]OCP25618.1 DNA-packaging protein [Ensifer sp. LC54]
MTGITPELAKQHMKVDSTDEDALIELYIEAAEQYVANYVGKPLTDLDPFPADLKLAILRLVAFYYEVRNIATFGLTSQLAPHGVAVVLDSYRERWFHDGE